MKLHQDRMKLHQMHIFMDAFPVKLGFPPKNKHRIEGSPHLDIMQYHFTSPQRFHGLLEGDFLLQSEVEI